MNSAATSRVARRLHRGLASGLIVLLAEVGVASGASLAEFFRTAADAGATLDPNELYPKGRLFPMTMFSVGGISGGKAPDSDRRAVLKRYRADGFTMIGPQYELNDRILADAKATGLRAFYTIGLPLKFHAKKPPTFTRQDVEDGIRKQVLAVAERKEIGWWYLQPEELRYWRKNEMMYLEAAAETIRKADPLKRPVWMYDPGHRTAEGLAHTVKYLDVCGKGIYTNYSGQRDSRIWVRWSIEQEVDAIQRANPKAIPIAVPEMFQQPEPGHLLLIPKWVRHDVYLSLISGAKGIVVFSMRRRPKFTAHESYYKAYAETARELCGALNLGQVFLFGERRSDVKINVLQGPRQIAPKEGAGGIQPPAKTYGSVSILDVATKDARYLFAVNSANVPVVIDVGGLPAEKIIAEDAFKRAEPIHVDGGRFRLRFEPLEVKAFRFLPAIRRVGSAVRTIRDSAVRTADPTTRHSKIVAGGSKLTRYGCALRHQWHYGGGSAGRSRQS